MGLVSFGGSLLVVVLEDTDDLVLLQEGTVLRRGHKEGAFLSLGHMGQWPPYSFVLPRSLSHS